MDIEKLRKFLLEAIPKVYQPGTERKKIMGGWQSFRYTSQGFILVDTFRGFNPFAGYALVHQQGSSTEWMMNYYGKCFTPCTFADDKLINNPSFCRKVYSFLQFALQKPDEKFPIRGATYKFYNANIHPSFTYILNPRGSISDFTADEQVVDGGYPVYQCFFTGGILRSKESQEKSNNVVPLFKI